MVRRILMVIVLVCLAGFVPATAIGQSEVDCTYPVEVTDATGATMTIENEPNRVVTLNPSAAQTMWEIGAWEKVVGASRHASNLDGFDKVENISGAGKTINNEEVVGLEPDLVLAPNVVGNDTVLKLREVGLTVYRFREAETIADIKDKVRLIGKLVGACDGAAETVDWMESRLAVVDEAVADQPRPTALYTFFGYTAGDRTFINQLIQRAGAVNGAAAANITGYKPINEEILVPMNPDWLILNSDSPRVPKTAAYNSTEAVKKDQIVVVNTNHLNRPAPRVVYAVEKMAQAFHPEAYAAANTSTPTPTKVASPTSTFTTEATATSTPGGDGAGFGFVAALAGMLTLLVIRR